LSDATVTLTCSDDISGCNVTYYCVDTANTCTPNIVYTEPIVITDEGTSYVRFYSVDNEGNVEDTKYAEIKIDKTPPVTTIEIIGEKYDGYYRPNVTIRLTCEDNVSGCYATYYCVDTTNTCEPTTEYTEEFELTEGTWYVRYYSEDVAGNEEEVNSVSITVKKEVISPARLWLGLVPIIAGAGYILLLIKLLIEGKVSPKDAFDFGKVIVTAMILSIIFFMLAMIITQIM